MRRRIAIFAFIMFLFVPALCPGAERFQLESELHDNYNATGTTEFLTRHTYDANGNRVQSRVWSGSDSMTEPMSGVRFTYNISGNCIEELLLSGGDTLTIVRYAYGDGKLLAARTLRKDGSLRFIDSLIYDGQGRKIEEQRISSAGVKTFFHRYTLNAQGKLLADSLFEFVAGSYTASQAVIVTCNADLTVATETKWQLSGIDWYCMSTAFLHYSAGRLSSVVTFERDGSGTGMTDSLVYTYDGFGNRTVEEAYDGDRALSHRIIYAWRDMQTPVAHMNGKTSKSQRSALIGEQGRLKVDLMQHDCGVITLYTMAGKRISRTAVSHSGIVPLLGLTGRGSYVAVFTSGIYKQVINFKNYNSELSDRLCRSELQKLC